MREDLMAAFDETDAAEEAALATEGQNESRLKELPPNGQYDSEFKGVEPFNYEDKETKAKKTAVKTTFMVTSGEREGVMMERVFWPHPRDVGTLFDFTKVLTGKQPTDRRHACELLAEAEDTPCVVKVSRGVGAKSGKPWESLSLVSATI